MACDKRPYLCLILGLGTVALFLHLVGFVAPGWLIMRTGGPQKIDDGGIVPDEDMFGDVQDDENLIINKRQSDGWPMGSKPEDWDSKSEELGKHRPHQGHRPGPHHRPGHHRPPHGHSEETGEPEEHPEEDPLDVETLEEMAETEQWLMKARMEQPSEVQMNFGLWYSTLCVRYRRGMTFREKRDSSDSEDEDYHGKRCRCKKISTKCAILNAFIFEDPYEFLNPMGSSKHVLSSRNFGYASLTEHRVENCLVLVFLVLGMLAAIAGFRNMESCRCCAIACAIFMFLAAFIAIAPVARLGYYSHYKADQKFWVRVHVPYSVIATGVGALFSLITAIIACCGTAMKFRSKRTGGWYKFNNEMVQETEKEKAFPIAEKPGLYDVCDFGTLKPVLEMLPEKNEVA